MEQRLSVEVKMCKIRCRLGEMRPDRLFSCPFSDGKSKGDVVKYYRETKGEVIVWTTILI
ncbi:hypothetical protein LBYZC6_15410 [Lacrimispora brassicae]